MILEVQELINEYTKWLKDKTTLRQIEDWVEITTPFLDRHNDHLQIFAKKLSDENYLLTDDGYIISDLQTSGCNLDTVKRAELLKITLNGFGVKLESDALTVTATSKSFSARKHSLIQAMLAVNDMFYLASPIIKSLFLEDVTAWLDSKEIRYVPNTKFSGASGYDHLFDFVIPSTKVQPERILKAINRPSKEAAELAAFAWLDTKSVRKADSKAYAIINDREQRVSPQTIEALKSYDINPVLWSQRSKYESELAA